MKITIESNLWIQNTFEPPMELELGPETGELRDVLQKLSGIYPTLRLIDHGEMGEDLHYLYLNGESHFSFSEGLRKKINTGDTIMLETYLEPIDGH